MISGMTRLFSYVNGKKGYYRWYNGLKYLLFEYEESITTKNDNPGLTIKDFDATSIEHIIPQTYETYWNRVMEQYISQFEVKEEKELAEKIAINTLGNLCLLKGGNNSELWNKSWKDKRERFNDGSFSEREVAKVDNWNLPEVYNRGVKLLNFICKKIDGLELTEEDIKCLLFVKETYYIDDIRNNRSSEL